MAGRLLFEIFVFSLPFLVFGIYLLATRSAQDAGRRRWPVQALFLTGLALAVSVWFVLIALEPRQSDMCIEPARYENGELIEARAYPCERRPEDVGVPRQRLEAEPSDEPT